MSSSERFWLAQVRDWGWRGGRKEKRERRHFDKESGDKSERKLFSNNH